MKISLELIQNIANNNIYDLKFSVNVFDSLAFIIWDLRFPTEVEEEKKWAYLIAKQQDRPTDSDFPRLINSFLYSQKGKSSITCNVLKMISALIGNDNGPKVNDICVSKSDYVPPVLRRCMNSQIDNSDVIKGCLNLALTMVRTVTDNGNDSDIENEPHKVTSFVCDLLDTRAFCPQLIVVLYRCLDDLDFYQESAVTYLSYNILLGTYFKLW
jgi:hypothetical protein